MSNLGSKLEWYEFIRFLIKKNPKGQHDIDRLMEQNATPESYRKELKERLLNNMTDKPNLVFFKDREEKKDIVYINEINNKKHFEFYANKIDFSRAVVFGNHSQEICERFIPDPTKTNVNYSVKGLVIGHIQSGKTGNMEALVCRAVDHGYKLIIIFSGRTNDLRSQTQRRFGNEVISKGWHTITEEGSEGDLKVSEGNVKIAKSEIPIIGVVKKHTVKMEQLIEWINKSNLKEVPALIIDDEADEASINTQYKKQQQNPEQDVDPSKTNRLMRKLLETFDKSVYVGFSATPYANVFIDATLDDLYPKDFIYVLQKPEGYCGAEEFLCNLPEQNINPICHIQPRKVKNEWKIEKENIQNIIYYFILSSCYLIERKNRENNHTWSKNLTMLIHSHFKKSSHEECLDEIKPIVKRLKGEFLHNQNKYPATMKRLQDIFDKEFQNTEDELDFDTVWKNADYVLDKLKDPFILNSSYSNELKYEKGEQMYILIGGNKLSRGITFENLLVSVYLRDPKIPNADTLGQMQRWFGFRKSYADLMKIYTLENISEQFKAVYEIEKQTREYLGRYSEKRIAPLRVYPRIKEDYNSIVRITSSTKHGASRIINKEQGKEIDITAYSSNERNLKENLENAISFLSKKKPSFNSEKKFYRWICSFEEIKEFIESHHFLDSNMTKNEILERCQKHDTWNVIMHNKMKPNDHDEERAVQLDGIKIHKIIRKFDKKKDEIVNIVGKMRAIERVDKIVADNRDQYMFLYIVDKDSNLEDSHKKKSMESPVVLKHDIVGVFFRFSQANLSGRFRSQ